MKLRIRYEKNTKVLSIEDAPPPTVGDLKTLIKVNFFDDWGLPLDVDFEVSLDGKTSVGAAECVLKDCGIVSGDLVKVILGDSVPVSSRVSDPGVEASCEPSTSAAQTVSAMSVQETDHDTPGPSQDNMEVIPCLSPGPIFFRDCDGASEVPHLVQKLYEDENIKNEFQALCIVLHFMMCESGFYVEGMSEEQDILPSLQQRIFAVEYSHRAGPNLKLSFSCNQLGSYVLVNAVVQPCNVTSEEVITLQIITKDYIESFNSGTKNSNAAAIYKNLSKLNRQVKETIAHSALNHMREELQLPPVHGLLSLFPEILQLVFSHLDYKSLVALSQVSKALHEITNDDNLWRNLYIKDFKSHPTSVETSWKMLYARRYIREKDARRKEEMDRHYYEFEDYYTPQFRTPDRMHPQPQPQNPFGMIGGEHDLHPSFPYGPFANPNRRLPPTRPVHPSHPDNPLPGSRFDPIYPGGGYRPGRGGGLMDPNFRPSPIIDSDFDISAGPTGPAMPFSNSQGRSRHNHRFGFI